MWGILVHHKLIGFGDIKLQVFVAAPCDEALQIDPQRFTRIIHVNTLNTRGVTLHWSGIDQHRFSGQWWDAINSEWKHQSILWTCALILKSPWHACIRVSAKVHLHPKHLNTASTRRMMASSQEWDDEDIYRRSLWILNGRNLLVSIAGRIKTKSYHGRLLHRCPKNQLDTALWRNWWLTPLLNTF